MYFQLKKCNMCNEQIQETEDFCEECRVIIEEEAKSERIIESDKNIKNLAEKESGTKQYEYKEIKHILYDCVENLIERLKECIEDEYKSGKFYDLETKKNNKLLQYRIGDTYLEINLDDEDICDDSGNESTL